ncbi:MAG: CehA/McbA family metallohydrolase [Chloroflexi bacterium]|nr:CehA/McbA family metallohydrolase [Chloroflexota bacterium]
MFQQIGLSSVYNTARGSAGMWEEPTARAIQRLPGGTQTFWGVPFDLGTEERGQPSLLTAGSAGSTVPVSVSVAGTATYLVFAHLCDSRASTTVAGQTADYSVPVVTAPGEHLADYVLVYADSTTASTPVRRRFEVNQVMTRMQSGFMCRPHQDLTPMPMRGPYPANMWGRYQTEASVGPAGAPASPREDLQSKQNPAASWSIYALPNPHPEKEIAELRIEPTGAATIGVGAVTLFSGADHPLRHQPLETLALKFRSGVNVAAALDSAKINLGVIARRYQIQQFDPETWLAEPVKGRGEAPDDRQFTPAVDVAASMDASLTVSGEELPLRPVYETGEATTASGAVSARVLSPQRTWIHGRVVDDATGLPVPARLHMRAPDGRYLPPYGHRHEVNDNWFEDYGADVKLGDTQYAYIDGTFQGELPVGEVYVEAARGFEYEPVRAKLQIEKGQRSLEIRLKKTEDRRAAGWVTADTHVHFLTPETAHLEAAAEGLNVINLLAAQWGDLFTNVGDITGRQSGASSDETIVWVGTENRQHFLGHISMLGVRGEPVFPMSTGGATEGYFGDPTARAMSEWADECREKGGLVVVPHFPFPHSEIIAEVVRGRVDGLEFWDFWTPTMDTFSFHEYYRLLNCGYRAAVVGGTDKMSAGMPVGNVRTYANIGDDALSFDSWADAVRAGRTYTTSGPLISFAVEGHEPGDEITTPPGGGRLHLDVSAVSLTGPVHRLEVVFNGRVVATAEAAGGASRLVISEEVDVTGSGWLAARCVSNHRAWSVWPQHIAAHTSPVFVKAGRDEVFDNPAAEYLVTVMEGGMAWLDTLATRADPERHAKVRSVFEEAVAEVRARQAARGHGVHSHEDGEGGQGHSHPHGESGHTH